MHITDRHCAVFSVVTRTHQYQYCLHGSSCGCENVYFGLFCGLYSVLRYVFVGSFSLLELCELSVLQRLLQSRTDCNYSVILTNEISFSSAYPSKTAHCNSFAYCHSMLNCMLIFVNFPLTKYSLCLSVI